MWTGGDHSAALRRRLESVAVPVVETWDVLGRPVHHNRGFSNAQACREILPIAGFGDFELARACQPQISTAMGQGAGEVLVHAIEAARRCQRLAPERVLMPWRVEMRGSTRRR